MTKKILITDDEKKLAEAMKLVFEKNGYQVFLAYNGEEGIDMAKSEKPDLIIMDIAMPRMDGYTAVKMIRKDDEIKHIPIVMVTAKDLMEEIFILEGVKDYVVKPFDYDVLVVKVKEILEKSEE